MELSYILTFLALCANRSFDILRNMIHIETYLCIRLKGLCHEINTLLKAYNNKKVLSVHALIVFTIFYFLIDEKIKLKVLA